MKLGIFCLIVLFALSIYGCKTAEEIKREKTVDTLSVQMKDSQKLSASSISRIGALEEKVGVLNGKIEEKDYFLTENQKALQKEIVLLKTAVSKNTLNIEEINKKLDEQKKYLNQVLSTLAEISGKHPGKKVSPYKRATSLYRKGRYSQAKKIYSKLLKSKKLRGKTKQHVLHNMGMIEFIQKRYTDSLVYFSRLFTKYPKSVYNPNGLLFLAKSFEKLNQKDRAKQTLHELIKRFPKKKSAKKAKKMLKRLK